MSDTAASLRRKIAGAGDLQSVARTSVSEPLLAFADSHFEREAQLSILIGSLLAAAVGIAILLTTQRTQAPGSR